jgi:hypothetical protein
MSAMSEVFPKFLYTVVSSIGDDAEKLPAELTIPAQIGVGRSCHQRSTNRGVIDPDTGRRVGDGGNVRGAPPGLHHSRNSVW